MNLQIQTAALARAGRLYVSQPGAPACVIHEDRGDGTPVCGTPLRDWQGMRAVYNPVRAKVTCQRCLR